MQAEGDDQIPVRRDGLQLDESRPFQRRVWAVQRIAWAAYALIVAAALAGATGRDGPLSMQHLTAGGVSAVLPRIARRGGPAQMQVIFAQAATDHRLLLPTPLLDHFEVEGISPRPVAELAVAGGVLLLFAAAGPPPHRASLHLRATQAGWARMDLTADDAVLPAPVAILP